MPGPLVPNSWGGGGSSGFSLLYSPPLPSLPVNIQVLTAESSGKAWLTPPPGPWVMLTSLVPFDPGATLLRVFKCTEGKGTTTCALALFHAPDGPATWVGGFHGFRAKSD